MKATLFDFNGVLIDDESVHLAAFRDVLVPRGISLDEATYEAKYLGFDDAGAFDAILRDNGQTPLPADIARLIEAKKPVYMRLIRARADSVIFDGAVALVKRRAEAGVVGIVSGALRHEIEHALHLMGVARDVAFIVSAEDTARCKPDPEGYELAVSQLATVHQRTDRAAIAVIEDSVAGITAAKRAGLRCAAVSHTYRAAELQNAGANVVVARLSDLTDAVIDALGTTAESAKIAEYKAEPSS